MVLPLVYCSMQMRFSVRAQLVVLSVVAHYRAPQNTTALCVYLIGHRHLCQPGFVCTNSVTPFCVCFFSSSSCCSPAGGTVSARMHEQLFVHTFIRHADMHMFTACVAQCSLAVLFLSQICLTYEKR